MQIENFKLKIVLLFAICNLQFAFSQPYRIRVDSLKVDSKIWIKGTDRTTFFDYLNANNRVVSATIENGSILNEDITNPNILFQAGAGLYGSGGLINLGESILFQVNVDDQSLEIADDTLNIKASGVTTSHIANGTVQNEDITNPNILFNAGEGLYGSGGQVNLGGSILFQVNVDGSTLEITDDTLNVKDGGITNAKLQYSNMNISSGDGLNGGGITNLGESVSLGINVKSPIIILNDSLNIGDSSIVWTKLDTAVMDSIRLGDGLDSAEVQGIISDSIDLLNNPYFKRYIPSEFYSNNKLDQLEGADKSYWRVNPSYTGFRIVYYGDSITRRNALAWYRILRRMYGTAGRGYDAFGVDIFGSEITQTLTSGWYLYSVGLGNVNNQATFGISGNSYRGGNGDTLSYIPNQDVLYTDIRLWYLKTPDGGNFKFVDVTNTDTTIISTAAASNILGAIRLKNINANSIVENEFKIIVTSDSVTVYGIEMFSEKMPGIIPYYLVQGSLKATILDDYLQFQRTFLDSIQPNSIHIWLGVNDALTTSTDNYATAIRTIVDTILAIDTVGITLYTHYPRNYPDGIEDMAFTDSTNIYRDSLFAISKEKGLNIFDIKYYFPSFRDAYNNGFYDDAIHPTNTGAAFLGQGLADLISPRKEGFITVYDNNFIQNRLNLWGYSNASNPVLSFYNLASTGLRTPQSAGIYSDNAGQLSIAQSGLEIARFGGQSADQNAALTIFPSAKSSGITWNRDGSSTVEAFQISSVSSQMEIKTNNAMIIFKKSGTTMLTLNTTGSTIATPLIFPGGLQLDSLQFKNDTVDSLQIFIHGIGWRAFPLTNSNGN